MQKKNRRPVLQRFWSNQGFQIKYSLLVVTITTAITLIFSYLYYKNEVLKTEILGIQNVELLEILKGNDNKIVFYLCAFFIFQLFIVFIIGVLLTHKVAGPLHRMENYINDLLVGKEPRQLKSSRKGDEFKSLFNAFMLYNEKIVSQRKRVKELVLLIKESKQDNRDEIEKVIKQLN